MSFLARPLRSSTRLRHCIADLPARFQFVAAMNPCPCGYLGHYSGRCACSPDRIAGYRSRISGPLLDRIDLHVEVPALRASDLADAPHGEDSAAVRARLPLGGSELQPSPADMLPERSRLSIEGLQLQALERARKLLGDAVSRLSLSARGFHRVLKVARTIADLAGRSELATGDVAEAVQYRPPRIAPWPPR